MMRRIKPNEEHCFTGSNDIRDYIDIKIIACYKGVFNRWSKSFMREKTEIKNDDEEHTPSSCKLVLEMLANQPKTYNVNILAPNTITNPNNNSANLVRAYIACQNRLEISPLLSTSKYAIFVSPEKADEHAAEAQIRQQHGKFPVK